MARKPGKGKASGKAKVKNLTVRKAAGVKGGSLNTYQARIVGEKQGVLKGG